MATLRIWGDELIPDEISRVLGGRPTIAHSKGEELRVASNPDQVRVARFGSWHLEATASVPEDVNGQVAELLSKLTTDLSVWASIADKFKVDVFCGLFMVESNEGFSLSTEAMSELASRGIEIGFVIYDPDDGAA